MTLTKSWRLATAVLVAAGRGDGAVSGDVARGEYLVDDLGLPRLPHPLAHGAERTGAGHDAGRSPAIPQDIVIDGPGQLPEPWIGGMNATNTAWSGPWGVSFAANLTPDPETGIWREMTEEQFIEALRTGRHLGQGRPILPPMPWPLYGQMTDADLKAIYAYLQTIPPVKNKVPDPLPPAQ